jgi:hypothetical protein
LLIFFFPFFLISWRFSWGYCFFSRISWGYTVDF